MEGTMSRAKGVFRDWPLVLGAATLLAGLGGCGGGWWNTLDWGNCTEFSDEYGAEIEASGHLLSSVPATTESYPMALVLSQDAINGLFGRLADTQLPELSESATVMGQSLGVSVRPSLPLLSVGGQGSCRDCLGANVPFDVGLSMAGFDLPRGSGAIRVQMPVRLVPEGDQQTALVAEFQRIEVLGLELDFARSLMGDIYDVVEPLVSTALTRFLQSRFADARILTLDSWEIGAGEVFLAGRGPFVFPEAGTMVVAMQSNLPLATGATVEAQAQLPPGADLGVVIHPGLLGSMGRRMLFEGVIPQSYDEQGNADEGGATRLTLRSVSAAGDGLLRAQAQLWRTGSACGSADLSASIGFAANPSGVSFAVRDIEVSGGRGSGQLLERADQLAGGFLDALVDTLEVTVNYDEIFGGERGGRADVETFEFLVDGGGVRLYLDLVD
jgi:hypothetical protein